MTTTLLTKPVTRTVASAQGAALVVTLALEGVYVRLKGHRTHYGPVTYGALLYEAVAVTTGKPRPTARRRPRHPRRTAP
jgi:hypothetical protein